jgi:DNA-directed RNA polymerase subunit RPC12/RpoP
VKPKHRPIPAHPNGSDATENSPYAIQRPLILIPIRGDLFPDLERQRTGISLEIGSKQMTVDLEGADHISNARVMVGIEDKDFTSLFTTAFIKSQETTPLGVRLHLELAAVGVDLLLEEAIQPQLNARTYHLEMQVAPEVLEAWCSAGVLRRRVVHRAYVCPDCSGIPVCGTGCQNCGSAHLVPSCLVHHFACAHVAHAHDFLRDNEIVCPKCHVRSLVVGADYENLDGPYRCLDCGHSATELETVGTCAPCGLRFPLSLAPQQEIMGYHASRLDIQRLADQV